VTDSPAALRAGANSVWAESLGSAYDWAACFCAAWFLLGLFADGWSHYHDVRESFFTPYHAVLYSGYFSNVALVAYTLYRGRQAGRSWRSAFPAGYDLTALGVLWFSVGVIPDMLWHRIFGIEEGIDVLISPTHLFLGIGMALILLGPARAGLARRTLPSTLDAQLPMVISLALFLAMIEFTLQFAFDAGMVASNAPLDPARASRPNLAFYLLPFTYYKEALGITIVAIHAALVAGFALYLVRRTRPALGTFVVLFGLPAFLMAALLSNGALSVYVPTVEGLASGLLADLLVFWLRPEQTRLAAARSFGALVPALTFAIDLAVAQFALGGVWWDVNLTFGCTLFAGVAGFLLSFLAFPPEPGTPPA
jgi:hypothetical protein